MASDKIRFRKATNEYKLLDKEEPFEFPNKEDVAAGLLHDKKTDRVVEDYVDDQIEVIDDGQKRPFDSVFVIEFHPGVKKKAIHWLVDKIRAKKAHGGAELLVLREPFTRPSHGLTIHISATDDQLLALADEGAFMKRTKSGIMRNFNTSCIDDFLLTDKMKVMDILTPADRQVALKSALDSIRAVEHETFVPGYELRVLLYKGQRIIDACLHGDIIRRFYAPHDHALMRQVETFWLKRSGQVTTETIRKYFGESIGMYFSFLTFYTLALVVPAVLGCCMFFIGTVSVPFICIYYVVWTTIVLELWKRRGAAHAYNWGTISMTYLDRPRGEYHGPLGLDPITGRMCPQYPVWKTYARMYGVSYPIVLAGAAMAFFMSMGQFWAEDHLRERFGGDSYIMWCPSIVYSIAVAIFSNYCEQLATWLTNMENHRTQMQFERHLINKMVILESINNFYSLFYIAFVIQDITMLQWQLISQLTTAQLVQNFGEMTISWCFERWDKFWCKFNNQKPCREERRSSGTGGNGGGEEDFEDLHIDMLGAGREAVKQSRKERFISEYHTTYHDYLQIYIQFGYVTLFSSVVPMAALIALVNNVIEIRLDIFKLQKVYKRPFAERAKDIGSWQLAFEAMALVSIISNLGMAYLTPEIRELKPEWTNGEWILNVVILEHVLLVVIWCIHRLIPDRPHWVRVALARSDYQSQLALKREATQRNRYMLLRRFRSMHGPTSPYFTVDKHLA